MTDIDLTDPKYKDAAYEIAAKTPALKDPTTPPIHWRVEGGKDGLPLVLRVLLADGRTVRRPLPVVGARHVSPKAPELMALPTHPAISPGDPPANLKPNGKHRSPANHKAGS
jgi:hypothetical protein